jgi:hypothetical protein
MTLEERVAYLEGRGEEHAAAIAEVRLDVRELRTDVRDLRSEMNRRFDQMDAKFNTRFEQMDATFDRMDTKFAWLIGFQFAGFLGIIAALLRR